MPESLSNTIDFTPVSRAWQRHVSRIGKACDSFRLFHGRGGMYPELEWCTIDVFYPSVVVTLFRLVPEISRQALVSLLSPMCLTHGITDILIQHRYQKGAPFECVWGKSGVAAHAWRKGLKFHLSFSQQNIGFFLDIEPARTWLESNVKGLRVLNLFSYTCAFSVVSMNAGAKSVVNIDLSRRALDIGKRNHLDNGLAVDCVRFLPHDIFKSWGKLKRLGPFDIVIIDPPSFQKGSFIAEKDYGRVLAKMPALVAEKGVFLACLNAPEVKRTTFAERVTQSAPDFTFEKALSLNQDFPDKSPEHALKLLVYRRN